MLTVETFQKEAAQLVREFGSSNIGRDPQRAEMYFSIFISDYAMALNSDHPSVEKFLGAYTYRELARRAGASEEEMDTECYLMRCEWTRKQMAK